MNSCKPHGFDSGSEINFALRCARVGTNHLLHPCCSNSARSELVRRSHIPFDNLSSPETSCSFPLRFPQVQVPRRPNRVKSEVVLVISRCLVDILDWYFWDGTGKLLFHCDSDLQSVNDPSA